MFSEHVQVVLKCSLPTLNLEPGDVGVVVHAYSEGKRAKHAASAKRVDAYRSLWGMNAGQLFGVAKCLTAWDELRRLATAPEHPQLKALWVLARVRPSERMPRGLLKPWVGLQLVANHPRTSPGLPSDA